MLELLTDPAVWASFLTLTILEIVLGVDNVIFISIASQKLPMAQQPRARVHRPLGRAGAADPAAALDHLDHRADQADLDDLGRSTLSWRDLLLLGGGVFLIWKATTEIFNEMEPQRRKRAARRRRATGR